MWYWLTCSQSVCTFCPPCFPRRFAKVVEHPPGFKIHLCAMDACNESNAGQQEVEMVIGCAGNGCLQGLPMNPNGESRAAEVIALIPLDSVEVARVQYHTQADEYKQSKLAPWRQYIEKHRADNLISVIGQVEDKNVIDLACRDGHYSRWLKGEKYSAGAFGVDFMSHLAITMI